MQYINELQKRGQKIYKLCTGYDGSRTEYVSESTMASSGDQWQKSIIVDHDIKSNNLT